MDSSILRGDSGCPFTTPTVGPGRYRLIIKIFLRGIYTGTSTRLHRSPIETSYRAQASKRDLAVRVMVSILVEAPER